jgi:hypothetical protein
MIDVEQLQESGDQGIERPALKGDLQPLSSRLNDTQDAGTPNDCCPRKGLALA